MPSSDELIAALDHGTDAGFASELAETQSQEPGSSNTENLLDVNDGTSLRAAAPPQPEDVSEKALRDEAGGQSSRAKDPTLDPHSQPQHQETPAKPDRLVLEKYAMYKTESVRCPSLNSLIVDN
jgi:hypothetical protein